MSIRITDPSALKRISENAKQAQKKHDMAERIAAEQKKLNPTWQEMLKKTIYNPEKGEVLTRTPFNWFRLILFYVIFYSLNAAFFYMMMKFFIYGPIKDDRPVTILDDSSIGTNPGMAFQPVPTDKSQDRGTLMTYGMLEQDVIDQWTNVMDDFLMPYQVANRKSNQIICDFNTTKSEGKVCVPDLSAWQTCNTRENYGYNETSPCFVLTINRVIKWEPEYYNKIEELPSNMPEDLVAHIKSLAPQQRNQVWVSCQPEQPVDNEQIGSIEIVSDYMGFPEFYFPFDIQPNYKSPLVAIQVKQPALNVILNIECRMWAKNIVYDGGHDRQGSVHIEFQIDDRTPPKKIPTIPRI